MIRCPECHEPISSRSYASSDARYMLALHLTNKHGKSYKEVAAKLGL